MSEGTIMGRIRSVRQGGAGRNLSFGAFSRVTALGSQFVVLILLGKFLEKSDFGDFMIVFAVVRVLSSGLGTGFATLLVYHISRNATPESESSLHRSVIALALVLVGAVSTGMMVLAPQIAGLFGKPSLVPWLVAMSPFLLFSTLLTISVGALDGRGRITTSITAMELIPNLIRLAALPALIPFGFPPVGIAAVMAVSVLLPWLFVGASLFQRLDAGFAPLTGWDLQYSGKLTLHSFVAMQMQGIDMLVVGWLFTSEAAADYAIASRVAALIPFFQQIIVKTFMTKAGQALHADDRSSLQRDIDSSRRSAITLVTLTAVAAMAGYPLLALIMGDFESSMPILALLAAGAVYRSYFPGADALIRISGHANFSLGIMLMSAAFLVFLPPLLISVMGVHAVAFAMLVSGVILNPLMGRFIRRELHVGIIERSVLPAMAIGLAGTAIAYFGAHSLWTWGLGAAVTGASLLALRLAPAPRQTL